MHAVTTPATVTWRATLVALAVVAALLTAVPRAAAAGTLGSTSGSASASVASTPGNSLETAASKAGTTGRQVAMSLIGLGFAIAAVVLSFRRDFKEAAGVFAVGLVAILLATPAGVSLLQDTVTSLFGSSRSRP